MSEKSHYFVLDMLETIKQHDIDIRSVSCVHLHKELATRYLGEYWVKSQVRYDSHKFDLIRNTSLVKDILIEHSDWQFPVKKLVNLIDHKYSFIGRLEEDATL